MLVSGNGVKVVLNCTWSRVLLEKLTGFQLVKKFPTFYGTWRFITAFTSARHLSLPWASSIQSIPLHPTSWRFILTSHFLKLYLNIIIPYKPASKWSLSLRFPPPKPCIHLSSPPYALRAPPIQFLSILSPVVRSTSSYGNCLVPCGIVHSGIWVLTLQIDHRLYLIEHEGAVSRFLWCVGTSIPEYTASDCKWTKAVMLLTCWRWWVLTSDGPPTILTKGLSDHRGEYLDCVH